MTKRRLTAIRLDKIAAVDRPCQEHATVAIIKHAPDETKGLPAVYKVTFQEALDGNMIAGAVNEAFFDSFDGLWERNDAFREALTDEFAEGGDGTVASAAYVASVKQLVDDAVAAAREAGATASDTTVIDKAFTATAEEWLAVHKSKPEEHTMPFTTKAALQAAISKYQTTGALPAVIVDIKKSAVTLGATDLLPPELADPAPAGGDVAALAKTVERLTKSALLTGEVATHYLSLADDAARDTFLAKSATDQAAEVAEKNAGDPLVYKCKDGTEIRKSDGAVAAMMAKRLDQQDVVIAKLTESGKESAIEKALAKYPNVAKGVATTILKAAENGTAEEKAAAEESLVAMNKALGGVFKRSGSTATVVTTDVEGGGDTPVAKMDAIVKRIADADNISIAKATVKASEDPEFQQLYAESLESIPAVAAAE